MAKKLIWRGDHTDPPQFMINEARPRGEPRFYILYKVAFESECDGKKFYSYQELFGGISSTRRGVKKKAQDMADGKSIGVFSL